MKALVFRSLALGSITECCYEVLVPVDSLPVPKQRSLPFVICRDGRYYTDPAYVLERSGYDSNPWAFFAAADRKSREIAETAFPEVTTFPGQTLGRNHPVPEDCRSNAVREAEFEASALAA